MLAAGLIAGSLPLVHAHTFVSIMASAWVWLLSEGVALATMVSIFAGAAIVGAASDAVAVQQRVQTSRSLLRVWMDHGKDSIPLFWLKNTGLFIPL